MKQRKRRVPARPEHVSFISFVRRRLSKEHCKKRTRSPPKSLKDWINLSDALLHSWIPSALPSWILVSIHTVSVVSRLYKKASWPRRDHGTPRGLLKDFRLRTYNGDGTLSLFGCVRCITLLSVKSSLCAEIQASCPVNVRYHHQDFT